MSRRLILTGLARCSLRRARSSHFHYVGDVMGGWEIEKRVTRISRSRSHFFVVLFVDISMALHSPKYWECKQIIAKNARFYLLKTTNSWSQYCWFPEFSNFVETLKINCHLSAKNRTTVSSHTVCEIVPKKAYTVWNYTVRDYCYIVRGPKNSKNPH